MKRYEFISKFCYGKILDCKFSNFSSFHSAQILLEKNCDEVFTYNKKTDEIVKRIKKNNVINYERRSNSLDSEYDCIISFETNFKQMSFEETVEKYSKLLNENGKLFISVINEEKKYNFISNDEFQEITIKKERFVENLEKFFKKIELYSHMIKDEEKPSKIHNKFNSVRSIGAKLLSSVDKNRSFYIDHLQNRMKKIDQTKNISTEISEFDYIPIQNMNEHNPFYFLAICEKN